MPSTEPRPPTKRTLVRAFAALYDVSIRSVWSDENISCSNMVSYEFTVQGRDDIPALFVDADGDEPNGWDEARRFMGYELSDLADNIIKAGARRPDQRRVKVALRILQGKKATKPRPSKR